MRLMARRLLPAAVVACILAGVAGYLAIRPPDPRRSAPQFAAGSLAISEPFVLATQPGATTAAGYMTIENSSREPDRLISATAEIAARASLRQTASANGVTEIHDLPDGVAVPAGGTVTLRPGSYQVFFEGVDRPLQEGETFAGTLVFQNAGSIDVTYQVGEAVAPIGGAPFELVDADGEPFSSADLAGEPYAIFFGYTHCPDVCPTTLFEMSEALKALGADADKLHVVFVTVDPARDTPELLKNYLSAFDDRIIGLTGTPEAIDAAAKSFRVFYRKVPTEDGDYSMDHSATVILMGAYGEFVGTISYGENAETRLGKLRNLLRHDS
jgi:protein SCO1/2